MYDFIIIGGGISGLYCGLELLKHNKHNKIVICEKYKSLGGRVSTFYKGSLFWEAGAGRISKKHTHILELLKKYNHPCVSISKDVLYKNKCIEPNIFEELIPAYFDPLKKLPYEVLGNNTLKELLIQIHGKEKTEEFLDRFPYRSEVEVLRADLGLLAFNNEMGSHEDYVVSKIGLSNLIESMKKDYLNKGGEILYNYECINIYSDDILSCEFYKKKKEIHLLKANRIICAMESEALKKIPYFNNWLTLKRLRMEPLLRTYAIYNTHWFSQYPRIVTKSPIRYWLPINYDKNVAMVSYTDSRDTNKFYSIFKKYGETYLGNYIHSLLQNLFGPIPKHTFFKQHYWKHGATYWLPGNYNVVEESHKSLKPFDHEVYIVGESFSLKQAWIEGSLEQCNKLFDTYRL